MSQRSGEWFGDPNRETIFMICQYTAILAAILMALVNTISVIAQSQNETNETGIGENQTVSGRISGFGGDLGFGPKVIEDPGMVNSP
jgi:hypothetical protein